ncbi:hypothetical protein [Mycobacterium sp. IDR2000157661]|uniref:hypothetical protein n=1 Tax=Mycobacterium sp. IDR2000157661 TaxID=2867005 RepID=UPI001EEA4816|nr:hypothetical protein [Mycobacterium sp. IDR2000157661]
MNVGVLDETDDDASSLRDLIERQRPDPGPVEGRWALGVGDMIADHSLTPDKLRWLVRKPNHFAGVAISEESVEFDGDSVEWADIEQVRTRSMVGTRELTPGMLAAVILADPAVRACLAHRNRYWTATRSSACTAGRRMSEGRSAVERPSIVASSVWS